MPRVVQFTPRLASMPRWLPPCTGEGVTRMFSYHVAAQVESGELELMLIGDEHPPLPVHLVSPHGRLSVPRVRAFVDFAVPRLRTGFARWAQDTVFSSDPIRSPGGRLSVDDADSRSCGGGADLLRR
jgi:hypothetical protein